MTDAPEPPLVEASQEPTAPHTAPAGVRPPWLVPAAIAAAVIVLGLGYALWNAQTNRADEPVVVEPYTPETELVSASERVRGFEAPDTASPVAVEFGQGVTLNVTGRVNRGIGNDWYAVTWNERVVYVRATDAAAGSGAPPEMVVRERPPPVIIEEEDEKKPEEEDVAGSPFAEPAPPSGALSMGDVNWVRAPNARDFARFYPDRAIDAGVSGSVTLDCIVGGGGRLACSVAGESPDGYGFGRAAINISRQLRVDTRLSDGSSAAGRSLILPLSFRAG
jgi:hypothetical protein